MPIVDFVAECPVHNSFRVQQIAGMFNCALMEKSKIEISAEVPDTTEDWQIGMIVGPSGSGKTLLAKKVFGEALYQKKIWSAGKAVIDDFGDLPIKQVTKMLTSVGFSSPPAWIKPYSVLSNGEQFRCNLARSLLSPGDIIAFDEFTSVVDRTVGKICSAAVSKAIRKGHIVKRFVAITCHYDILEWLEPDWVLDMATCTLERRRLRRPEIKLKIFRCHRNAWRLFAKHHYLNTAKLSTGSTCYLTMYENVPVCFVSVMAVWGFVGARRISRIVTLPDYQGVGIGRAVLDAIADLYFGQGIKMFISMSHPAMIASLKNADDWKCAHIARMGNKNPARASSQSAGRAVISFCYYPRKVN